MIRFPVIAFQESCGGVATTEFIVLENGLLAEKSTHLAAKRGDQRDPLTHEVHLTLTRAYTTLTAVARRNNPSSLSLGRYNVLRLLYGSEDRRLLMSEIGEGLEISPTVVTRLVDSLVAEGLVQRVDHPDDKRKTWAEITPNGLELFEAEMPLMAQEVSRLWEGMADEEKRMLIHLLSKLRLNLISMPSRDVQKRVLSSE